MGPPQAATGTGDDHDFILKRTDSFIPNSNGDKGMGRVSGKRAGHNKYGWLNGAR
jgi:hypothetical protein